MDNETSVIDKSGILSFKWPDELTDIDVVLATHTKPRKVKNQTDSYPNSIDIAEHFSSHPEYFLRNWINGIRTSDDELITKLMAKPDLLSICRDVGFSNDDIKLIFAQIFRTEQD